MKMSKNGNRFSRRKIARSNALFQVRSAEDGSHRRVLSPREFEEYVGFISNNQNGKFGIGTLKDLELNSRWEKNGKTLLEMAVFHGRDVIVSLLLRAGASPLPQFLLESRDVAIIDLRNRVNHFLWNTNPYFAPYVVKLCLGSRVDNSFITCSVCGSNPTPGLFNLIPCKHPLCDVCFWESSILKRNNKNDDIACPKCDIIIAVNENDFNLYPLNMNLELDKIEPECISQLSRQKWLSLPDRFILSKKTKNLFLAMPMRAISCLYIGESKTGRTENLFKAVIEGNLIRIKALLLAGVDVDVMNEYGQTPVFLARWRNHYKIADLLISCGAKLLPDNAGHHPDDFMNLKKEIHVIKERNEQQSTITRLICPTLYPNHPGTKDGGSFLLEGFISDSFLEILENILLKLPASQGRKNAECSDRYYYCDCFGMIAKHLSFYIQEAGLGNTYFFPQMRFLVYPSNGFVPPHVDLARTCPDGVRSTHTFILYLSSSLDDGGGETVLLKEIPTTKSNPDLKISVISPKKSSLLIFPHLTPHEGRPALSPKILLRGEMLFI